MHSSQREKKKTVGTPPEHNKGTHVVSSASSLSFDGEKERKEETQHHHRGGEGNNGAAATKGEAFFNYAYRHGMSGKELKKRAKELKKRQMLERETKRLERRERRNASGTSGTSGTSGGGGAGGTEDASSPSAMIPIPMSGKAATSMTMGVDAAFFFSPSSASPRNRHAGAMASPAAGSPLTIPYANKSSYESDKEICERMASSSLDESRPLNLFSPTKYKQNRKQLRRLFGKLEFETLDKSSMDRVFVSCEIGKKSTKTVQLSEFLETPNPPYYAVRRVERNNSHGGGGVEVLWDVNFDVGAAKTENENKSVNIYNNNNDNDNNNDDGGGGDDEELGMFDANLEDDVDGDGDEDEIQKERSAETKNDYLLLVNKNKNKNKNNGNNEDVSPHDIFPVDIWRLVFAKLSPRETVLFGSACKMFYKIARAEETRNALFEKIFYRSSASLTAAEDTSSSSSSATTSTKSSSCRRNRTPHSISSSSSRKNNENVWRTVRDSYLATEPWVSWYNENEKDWRRKTVEPLYANVGPSFVRGLICDQQTVASYNSSSVKFWYNGLGDAKYNVAGGRIQTLEAKDSNIRDMCLTDNFVAVSENSGRVRSWSSLDGSPSIHRPMVTKRDANSSLLALHADSIVACCEKSCTAKIHDLARDASAYSSSDIEENVIMDLRTSKERDANSRWYVPFESEGEILGATCISKEAVWDSVIWFGTTLGVRGIDFNRNEVKETMLNEYGVGENFMRKIKAIAARGPVVTAALSGGLIVLVDRRSKAQSNVPIATFAPPWYADDHASSSNRILNEYVSEQKTCLHLEDERLIFHSESGYEGVCVYDIRKFLGPRMRRGTLAVPAWREDLVSASIKARARLEDDVDDVDAEEEGGGGEFATTTVSTVRDVGSFGSCASILTPFNGKGVPIRVGCFARFPNGFYNNAAAGIFENAPMAGAGNVVVAPYIPPENNPSEIGGILAANSSTSSTKSSSRNEDRDKCSVFTGMECSLYAGMKSGVGVYAGGVNKRLGYEAYEELMNLSLHEQSPVDSRTMRRKSTQPKTRGRYPKRQGRN